VLDRLHALTALLRAHDPVWRERAFFGLPLAWEAERPEWAAYARSRPPGALEALLHDDVADAPDSLRAVMAEARALCALPPLPSAGIALRPELGVPGRKWAQVTALAGVALGCLDDGPRRWLDWCAGKGHLGRTLGRLTGAPVRALERDAALCAEGARLAAGLDVALHPVDVLTPAVDAHLDASQTAVALHACGALHHRLAERAADRRLTALLIAPCCYDLVPGDAYVPLSDAGRAHDLALTRDELRLPLEEEVVAGAADRRERRRAMAWRLGLDQCLRDRAGVDRHHRLPPAPRSWHALGFAGFCVQLAERGGLPLDAPPAPEYEPLGFARLEQVERLDGLRTLFRRAVETWLVLDLALSLESAGYAVRVGTFCDRAVTPRNLAVVAVARADQAARRFTS
jgi:hypothetical protein